jgi:hypothetical protein
MQLIEVNAMTGLVEMLDEVDMPPEQGFTVGWGWTHWDGPDAGGDLFALYRCQNLVDKTLWIEVYVEGELTDKLDTSTDVKQWVIDKGWRPVVIIE